MKTNEEIKPLNVVELYSRRADRQAWQALFDIYRANGGPLGMMDNMLIDLRMLKEAIDSLEDVYEFVWGFHESHGHTSFIPRAGWVTDAAFTAQMECFTHSVRCVIEPGKMSIYAVDFEDWLTRETRTETNQ